MSTPLTPLVRRALRLALASLAVASLTTSVAILPAAQAAPSPRPSPAASTGASGSPEVFSTYDVSPGDPVGTLASFARIMATPSIDTGFVPHVDAPLYAPRRACPPKRCKDYVVPTPPSVKVTSSTTRVILPVGYATHPHKRYPTVYLFNGAASSFDGWSRKTVLTELSRRYQAIFVMPSGGYNAQLGLFSNWLNGQYDWETFHVHVLVPWVDKTFRTIPGDRAAVGVSVSVLGALGYAARHPGLFKSVLSISGMVEDYQLVTDDLPPGVSSAAGLFPVNMLNIWGDPVTHASTWNSHDPAKLADKLKGVNLFITAGTGFYTGDDSDPLHSGFLEQLLFQGERLFLEALDQAGVPYQARISEGNVHDWPYFDAPLRWGLPKLMATLATT